MLVTTCIITNHSLTSLVRVNDSKLQVSFVTIPSTSVFPSLTKNESFTCVFTDIVTKTIHNLTVQDSFCVGDNFNLTLLNTSFTRELVHECACNTCVLWEYICILLAKYYLGR